MFAGIGRGGMSVAGYLVVLHEICDPADTAAAVVQLHVVALGVAACTGERVALAALRRPTGRQPETQTRAGEDDR